MKKLAVLSKSRPSERDGATVIIVAIALVMLLGFGAFAVDIGYLYVVRNELQNAADAGALAGAAALYNNDGTAVQPTANVIGQEAAMRNTAVRTAVEVTLNGNSGDVQRGHYSFANGTFTPNASLLPVSLWNVSNEELDANTDFINAVKVTTHRSAPAAPSFFSRIFGYDSFALAAEAVAYIGFAGTLYPADVDQPIALCEESILVNGEYQCNIGRMINSGEKSENSETGGWTDFNQEGNPCKGGTNTQLIKDVLCAQGNPFNITLGRPMATNGGNIQAAFSALISCWRAATNNGTQPWQLTLPVITCPGNNVDTCQTVVGAVKVNVLWITGAGEDPGYTDVPRQMGNWSCPPDTSGKDCWESFVSTFNLRDVSNDDLAGYGKKSIYFLPDCTPHDLGGGTGGKNFGILAKVPVLVR